MSEPQAEPLKPGRDWPPLLVGAALMVGYFVVTSMLIQIGTGKEPSPHVIELITTLRDAFMLFIYHLYGHTASSARKTELLSKAQPIKEE